ncbi:hypothetical protein BH18ACI4_BH18ACI4_02390 [soil metagenome]
MRVLHIVPDSVFDSRHLHLGSTKDVRGRTEYFDVRGIAFDEIAVKNRSDQLLQERLKGINLSHYTTAIFELPAYPDSLLYLRRNAPQVQLLTRSINAELYHRLHYLRALAINGSGLPGVDTLKVALITMRTTFSRLRLDRLCANRSDYLLSITQWEKEHYWKYLTGAAKVTNVPYFLPRTYDEAVVAGEKKTQCVCMMSTTLSTLPFLIDAAKNFSKAVTRLGDELPEWEFLITGDFPSRAIKLPGRVTRTGLLATPFKVLAESRVMALLSDYGFGFKTKLLDAIHTKCYVLVLKGLYRRLPAEVQPFCIIVDTDSVDSFRSALERCREPYPDGDPNDIFRSRAFAALDELLNVGT